MACRVVRIFFSTHRLLLGPFFLYVPAGLQDCRQALGYPWEALRDSKCQLWQCYGLAISTGGDLVFCWTFL